MRKVRMGMIGGGIGSFIGEVHRMAARLDGHIELVCGAFSTDTNKNKQTGEQLYLPPNRVYDSFEEMLLQEKQLPSSDKPDFFSICTPNHLHYLPAKLALESGFHVLCDKPLTHSLTDAFHLKQELDNQPELLFGITYNYSAYPMIKEAKHLIAEGALGNIRKVIAEYPQGWLSTNIENTGHKQASWRTNPQKSGKGGCLGDIATHAFHLAEYVTNRYVISLAAQVSTFVNGRQLDDDVSILLKFDNGAKGILQASQIANGEENGLAIRIYGEKASLEWKQLEPNTLLYKQQGEPTQILRTGVGKQSAHTQAHYRIVAGHPEGFIEAFANLYRNFAFAIQQKWQNQQQQTLYDFPQIQDGIRGMLFVETTLQSANNAGIWTKMN